MKLKLLDYLILLLQLFCITLSYNIGNQLQNTGYEYPQNDYNRCGMQAIKPSLKGEQFEMQIVNGKPAVPNSWPWMCSLRIKRNNLYSHFCGCSLIRKTHVLTAAHCADFLTKNDFIIVIGVNYLNAPLTRKNTFFPRQIKINEKWDPDNILNDIALIELDRPVKLSRKVSLICLPPSPNKSVIYGKKVVVIGWGSTTGVVGQQKPSNTLLQTTLKIKNFDGTNSCFGLDNRNYCAIDPTPRESNSCQGDSGGPLMYYMKHKWYVYGLVSFGFGNETIRCINTLPSFYTIVPDYLKWIYRNLRAKY